MTYVLKYFHTSYIYPDHTAPHYLLSRNNIQMPVSNNHPLYYKNCQSSPNCLNCSLNYFLSCSLNCYKNCSLNCSWMNCLMHSSMNSLMNSPLNLLNYSLMSYSCSLPLSGPPYKLILNMLHILVLLIILLFIQYLSHLSTLFKIFFIFLQFPVAKHEII